MSTGIIIAGVAGLVALVVLGIGIRGIRGERQKEIEDRLGRYTSEYGSLIADFEEASQPDPVQQQSAITRRLDTALAGRGFAQQWRTQLARADLKLTVGEYAALHAISMAGFFLVGSALFNPITGGVVGIGGFFFPRFYVSRKQSQRLHQFEAQLPDTLSLWVNALRSGYSVCNRWKPLRRKRRSRLPSNSGAWCRKSSWVSRWKTRWTTC
jgi:tight adherence protein B